MESIPTLTAHVFAALAAIVLVASVFGRIAVLLRQPRVVGEMVAGVLMGPSLLGWLLPDVQEALFPAEVRPALYLLSMIGLVFFMFLVGAGIRHGVLDRRSTRGALSVGVVGVVVPLALGVTVAWALADQISDPGTPRLQVSLLLGGALTVTAFPMLARILNERGMQSSRLGAVTLLAASVDDAAAWIVLAVILALAFGGSMAGVAASLVGVAVFTVVMLKLAPRLLAPIARSVERNGHLTPGALAVVVLLILGAAWTTHELGIHFVFGGFIVGISLPASPALRECVRNRLMDMNVGLLLPVFFIYTGLNTDLGGLVSGSALLAVIAITAVAFIGKYLSCLFVMRALGHSWRVASAAGGLMNARGLMVLIFINIGLEHGVLSQDLFSILVLVAVVTTVAALPIYRLSLPDSLEAAERLDTADPDPEPEPATPPREAREKEAETAMANEP
ncbi:cation:proton antiporter [Nocardiopsis alborubida]|uniref:Cation:proton antiporter n=2 Tax=Nocardiopsis TaxID=2013 RepID=A0A7X6RNY3_9ACTN|nr:cation:proton antiporter [Nocardiopsis alborubida]NKY97164.1 cation:proton antiporter [Nocardiopsis alborubida]QOP59284.1 transporter [Nocardiopsis sp.]